MFAYDSKPSKPSRLAHMTNDEATAHVRELAIGVGRFYGSDSLAARRVGATRQQLSEFKNGSRWCTDDQLDRLEDTFRFSQKIASDHASPRPALAAAIKEFEALIKEFQARRQRQDFKRRWPEISRITIW